MPCACAGSSRGLVLGGQHKGPLNIGLAVRDGYVAKDFGVGACDAIVLLSGLMFEDSVDEGVTANDLSPHGRWVAQKLNAADTVGNVIICCVVFTRPCLQLTEAADRLHEVALVGYEVSGCLPLLSFPFPVDFVWNHVHFALEGNSPATKSSTTTSSRCSLRAVVLAWAAFFFGRCR